MVASARRDDPNAVAPPATRSRRQCTSRLRRRYGIEVQRISPVASDIGRAHSQKRDSSLTSARTP